MADGFGLKIGVEGEKEFKSALQDINQNLKVLGSEMTLVASSFDKNDKSVQALTSRNSVLNKEIEQQKDKIETLKQALSNASESFGENDKRTQSWQIQLNKAQAELNGMERELKSNEKALDSESKSLDETGKNLDDTGKETKKLGNEMDDAGKKTSVFGDVLLASLAAEAIKAGLSAIVDLVKSVGSAVSEYVSEGMGMATEYAQSQTLLAQVMRNTMDASDDQVNSLMKLAEAQEQVGVVSKTAQTTALAELASFVGRKESLEDMLPVMNDYIAYQYGTTASNEQARNVATALGKAINGSIDGLAKQGFTLTQNEKEWFKTASEMERVEFITNMVGESMNGVNEALAQTDAGKMANLKVVMDNTKIAVGSMANTFKAQILGQMLPSISALSEAFLGVLEGTGSVEEFAASFSGVFNEIANMIDTFLPVFIELGSKLLTGLVTGISENIDIIIGGVQSIIDAFLPAIIDLLPLLLDVGVQLLMGLLDGIISALPALLESAAQMITMLINGITDALPQLIPAAIQAVVMIVKGLMDNLPMLLKAALDLMLGLTKGLIDAIPQLVDELPAIIEAIVNFLVESIPLLVEAGVQLLVALVENMDLIIDSIVTVIPDIVSALVDAFITLIPLIIEAGVKLLIALVENLPLIITEINKAIPKIVTSIVNSFKEKWPEIKQAGYDLLISLVAKITETAAFIKGKLPEIGDAIGQFFTDKTDDLRRIGGDMIRGLWNGIQDVKQWILDKIGGFTNEIVDWVKAKFGVSSPSAVFARIGAFLAQGLGDGFTKEMQGLSKAIVGSIPTGFTMDTALDANNYMSGGARSRGASGSASLVINTDGLFRGAEINIRDATDIERLARRVVDKMPEIMTRRNRGGGLVLA